MRRAAGAAVALGLLLTGCATGTDDELAPRPTPTVTVTGAPQQRLPDRLELRSDLDFADAVVWARGTRLTVDGDEVDLGLEVQDVLVLDEGLLVLADERVWFVAGRRVVGLPLPPARGVGLSADGTQVLLSLVDRDEAVAWTTAGARVDDGAVAEPRSAQRTVTGPGEYAVVPSAGGPRVVDAAGRRVRIDGLPRDLEVAGWNDAETFYGTGRPALADLPPDTAQVLRCTVVGDAACEPVDEVPADAADELRFGRHPAG